MSMKPVQASNLIVGQTINMTYGVVSVPFLIEDIRTEASRIIVSALSTGGTTTRTEFDFSPAEYVNVV